MYRYETHLHTAPVSRCGKATVEETVRFYKSMGYDGIFVTNHFLDGNINCFPELPYRERLDFYFSACDEGAALGKEIGLKVFPAIETSYIGTDFLVYGLDRDWLYAHPECMELKKSAQLRLFAELGALIIQAHPFREETYIDHIRLFPRCIEGVEVINASIPDFPNRMAALYAENYGLLQSAGSDNHRGPGVSRLAGIETEQPICSVEDFMAALRGRETKIFTIERDV